MYVKILEVLIETFLAHPTLSASRKMLNIFREEADAYPEIDNPKIKKIVETALTCLLAGAESPLRVGQVLDFAGKDVATLVRRTVNELETPKNRTR